MIDLLTIPTKNEEIKIILPIGVAIQVDEGACHDQDGAEILQGGTREEKRKRLHREGVQQFEEMEGEIPPKKSQQEAMGPFHPIMPA